MGENNEGFVKTAKTVSRTVNVIVNLIIAIACIILTIYNFSLVSIKTTGTGDKVANIFIQILFTMPTIFLCIFLAIAGLISSGIGIGCKIKWIKITNIVLTLFFVAMIVCGVVAFVMLKSVLTAGA